jgi:hypothetical protein
MIVRNLPISSNENEFETGSVRDSWPASGNVEGRISCQDGRMNVELFQIKVKTISQSTTYGYLQCAQVAIAELVYRITNKSRFRCRCLRFRRRFDLIDGPSIRTIVAREYTFYSKGVESSRFHDARIARIFGNQRRTSACLLIAWLRREDQSF